MDNEQIIEFQGDKYNLVINEDDSSNISRLNKKTKMWVEINFPSHSIVNAKEIENSIIKLLSKQFIDRAISK